MWYAETVTPWESPCKATDLSKKLKEEKRAMKGGSSSQEVPAQLLERQGALVDALQSVRVSKAEKVLQSMRETGSIRGTSDVEMKEATMAAGNQEEIYMQMMRQMQMEFEARTSNMALELQARQTAASSQDSMRMNLMGEELRRMMIDMREKEIRQEAMFQTLMSQEVRAQRPRSPTHSITSTAGARVEAPRRVLCKCKKPAEMLRVIKEGPRKGRHFWKCVQRTCDFFEWEPEESTQRSKSPKRPGDAGKLECCSESGGGGPIGLEGRWMELRSKRERAWARRQQAQRMFSQLVVPSGYLVKDESGRWKEKTGLVPAQGEDRVKIWIGLSRRLSVEDQFEITKNTNFTNQQRKAVHRGMQEVLARYQSKKELWKEARVSEVYSPPRVSEAAKGEGLQAGTAFDLQTGWDLTKEADVKAMFEILEKEDPFLLMLCPPCTPFSLLQEWNFPRMELEKAIRMVRIGLHHLDIAVRLIEWQKKRGGYYVFEHPKTARS